MMRVGVKKNTPLTDDAVIRFAVNEYGNKSSDIESLDKDYIIDCLDHLRQAPRVWGIVRRRAEDIIRNMECVDVSRNMG